MYSVSFPLLSKARVYPNQLSFKLTQKICVSLGQGPFQKARPEDYCSPVSETGEKECQHSKALTKTVRKLSWLRRHVPLLLTRATVFQRLGNLPDLHCGLPITSPGPDLATLLQLVNAWRNFANLYLLKGPSTNSLPFLFTSVSFDKEQFLFPRGSLTFWPFQLL